MGFTKVTDDTLLSGEYVQICMLNEHDVQQALNYLAYPICLLVSDLFLLVTFFIYAYLPDLRRPVFGKITMVFLVSLASAYFIIAAEKLVG